MEGEQLLSQW